MAFSRQFLKDHGVPEDQIDAVMAERNRTLSDYVPKADMQAQIDAAVQAAKTQPVDVTKSPEYIALAGRAAKLEAFQTEDFASVKAPYKDIVWEKLDHGDKHKPYGEQIAAMAEAMPDLFTKSEDPAPAGKPTFGGPTEGSAPSGKSGSSFMDTWKFVPP